MFITNLRNRSFTRAFSIHVSYSYYVTTYYHQIISVKSGEYNLMTLITLSLFYKKTKRNENGVN